LILVTFFHPGAGGPGAEPKPERTLMSEGSLAATEAADTAKMSVRLWAMPADPRCSARTVCLNGSLSDQDMQTCRSW
jgi:hypothetical protein